MDEARARTRLERMRRPAEEEAARQPRWIDVVEHVCVRGTARDRIAVQPYSWTCHVAWVVWP